MRMQEAEIIRGHRGRRLTYEDAMGNDLVNAIIELVTNADDSYCALEDRGELSSQATIRIEIERHRTEPTLLIVRDRAEGMSRHEMQERLKWEGRLHRSFGAGTRKRGMFGSGAKEVTHFGRTVFESIKEDQYTRYKIPKGGGNRTERPRIGSESPDRHREDMGISHGSGTVVTIFVDSQQFRIPRIETLYDRLRTAPQLQPILQDKERRSVVLVDLNNPDENTERLLYIEPEAEVIFERREIIVPGYADAIEQVERPVTFTLKRAMEPVDEYAGLLVRAERTAFERDRLGLTNRPHADRFFGEVSCPFLWRLIAEAEARDSGDRSLLPEGENDEFLVSRSLNPSRPVSRRRRSGLDRTHPFIARLREQLRSLVNSERQRSVSQQTKHDEPELDEELRRELSEIAKTLGDFLEGEEGGKDTEPFRIVPDSLAIDKGDSKRFTVLAIPEIVTDEDRVVEVVIIDGEKAIRLDRDRGELEEQPSGNFSATFQVHGTKEGRATLLAALGSETGVVNIRVGAPEEEPEEEEFLLLNRNHYSVRADGSRSANVVASVASQLKDQVGSRRVKLILSGAEGISEAVTIDTPSPVLAEKEDGRWEATATLKGGRGGAGLTGRLTAQYGSMSVTARVRVTTAEEVVGEELPFEIKFMPGVEAKRRRYDWDKGRDPEILNILADHPSVKPFYEQSKQNGGSQITLTRELQTVAREIAAGAVAYRAVSEKLEREPNGPTETESALAEYEQIAEEALRQLYEG